MAGQKRRWMVCGGVALGLLLSAVRAQAQAGGECSGGICGTPKNSGGGCGCGNGGGGMWEEPATPEPGGCYNTPKTYDFADDYDHDGIEDDFDNCPLLENKSQADEDGDGMGDPCDSCPKVPDPDQLDTDGDGKGDKCDPDMDNDSTPNAQDNCPLVSNLDQADTDNDGQGDDCDTDDDNDKVLDHLDNCPLVANPLQDPPPGNPVCDHDTDQDNLPDAKDNCPLVANPDQADLDGDSTGDKCDPDIDDDKVLNVHDNCPDLSNPDQTDLDRDGRGDACDPRFCFVVNGDEKNCLDPQDTLHVYSPLLRVRTGEPFRLRLYANRPNAPLRYQWEVQSRPGSSSASVATPDGVVTSSDAFEYRYLKGSVPCFTADLPGEYKVKLSAHLVFPDTVDADNSRDADYLVTIVAEGEALGGRGCNAAPRSSHLPLTAVAGGLALLLGLAALFWLQRRRTR